MESDRIETSPIETSPRTMASIGGEEQQRWSAHKLHIGSKLSPLLLDFNSKMSFDMKKHCTRSIQHNVGLYEPSGSGPRPGDGARGTEQSDDVICAQIHAGTMEREHAKFIWDSVSNDVKTGPTNTDQAMSIATLARLAGEETPDECRAMLDTAGIPLPNGWTYYWTPGSPIETSGKQKSAKFISFVNRNMEPDLRVKWYNLSGREQFEWFKAWVTNDRTHDKVEPAKVLGLRGTNVTTLDSVERLRVALVVSPSLVQRRPADHTITAEEWTNTARTLDFDTDGNPA